MKVIRQLTGLPPKVAEKQLNPYNAPITRSSRTQRSASPDRPNAD